MPLGRAIGRAHKLVRTWGDRELGPLDSSVTEWIVLHHVDSASSPGASQSEIARFSDMGGPSLVRHIDRLEADGIVVRTRDPDDRRIIRLTLTDAGRQRLAAVREVMERCDERLRSCLTEAEADTLGRAAGKLFDFCLAELAGCGAPVAAMVAASPSASAGRTPATTTPPTTRRPTTAVRPTTKARSR